MLGDRCGSELLSNLLKTYSHKRELSITVLVTRLVDCVELLHSLLDLVHVTLRSPCKKEGVQISLRHLVVLQLNISIYYHSSQHAQPKTFIDSGEMISHVTDSGEMISPVIDSGDMISHVICVECVGGNDTKHSPMG
jgi:hypothetical protein